MRIAFLSRRYWPVVSGMSVYAENLIRQLRDGGHEVVMLAQYRDDPVGKAIYGGGPLPDMPGVEIVGVRSCGEERICAGHPADFEADIAELVRLTVEKHLEEPFDVIHAQYAYPTGQAALIAAQRLGLPSIVSIQGGDGHWVGLCCETHRRAMADVLDGVGALLIGTQSFAEEVHGHHGTPLKRFTVVGGATDAERFTPRTAPRAEGPPHLLYHGRVDLRKGLGELLEAAESLAEQGIDFRLTVSGIGPDLEEVRRRAAASTALSGRVHLPGYTDYHDAPDVYREADIFVSPTYSEGFSNTILEAMATRLPVVSTDTIGVVDCIEHERNGLLVPVRDAEALAAALARLIHDPALADRLAGAGLDDVRTLHSWPILARRIVATYEATAPHPLQETPLPIFASADLDCRFRPAPHLL